MAELPRELSAHALGDEVPGFLVLVIKAAPVHDGALVGSALLWRDYHCGVGPGEPFIVAPPHH